MSKNFNNEEYWENRLNTEYSLAGVGSKDLGIHYNNWLYKVRRKAYKYFVSSLPLTFPDIKCMDIGSGTGFYINLLKEKGARNVTGVDITEIAVSNLTKKYPSYQFIKGDISKDISFISGHFDLITCFDVLFHVVEDQDYKRSFKNISTVLAPDGYFIFSENLSDTSLSSSHYKTRTKPFIMECLKEANLNIVSTHPMFILMNDPVDTRSKALKLYWSLLGRIISSSNFLGNVCGFLLYPLEIVLLKLIKKGPSTQIIVCKKSDI